MIQNRRSILAAGLALGLAAAAAMPALAKTGDKAGVAGAVRGAVQRIAFDAPKSGRTVGKIVSSGDQIFLGDVIRTDATAGLQIMLLDQTTFTIGPSARMVIDEFVYDPKSGNGKMSARILKGTFRFVSGRIAEKNAENVTLKLPVASIGIRGTSIVGETDENRARVALVGQGPNNNTGRPASRVIVSAGGVTRVIFRTGFWVTIDRNGGITVPSRMSRNWYRRVHGLIMGLRFALNTRLGNTGRNRGVRRPLGQGVSVLTLSGQKLAEGLRPSRISRNQSALNDRDGRSIAELSQLQVGITGAFEFSFDDTTMTTINPVSTPGESFTMVYTLDFGSRTATGQVDFNNGGGLNGPFGSASIPVTINPFASRQLVYTQTGSLPGFTSTTYRLIYRFRPGGLQTNLIVQQPAFIGSRYSIGSQDTPAVKVQ